MAGRLMLERKAIGYRRVDLLPAVHKPLLRALGFPGTTVPALRIDGRRVQGTLAISRELERLVPQPALFPAREPARTAVEEAERWGESALQPVPRRLSWWAFTRQPDAMRSFAAGARLGVPIGVAMLAAVPVIAIERRINDARDEAVRADLVALPALLDRVDQLLAAGVIGQRVPNAADYQIATSIRLLMCFEDLAGIVECRPCGAYALRLVPEFPGLVPSVIPSGWLSFS